MNVLVVMLLMLGGFLVMDAVSEKRVDMASRSAKKTVRYVPLSIYDEQLSGRSVRDEFGDMFYSAGPWGFRDDFGGISLASEVRDDDEAMDLAFADLQRRRADLTSPPDEVAAERRRIEERIQARFDKLAEERMRRKAGLAPNDPLLETYASIPKDSKERRSARAARSAKRKQRRDRILKSGPTQ